MPLSLWHKLPEGDWYGGGFITEVHECFRYPWFAAGKSTERSRNTAGEPVIKAENIGVKTHESGSTFTFSGLKISNFVVLLASKCPSRSRPALICGACWTIRDRTVRCAPSQPS